MDETHEEPKVGPSHEKDEGFCFSLNVDLGSAHVVLGE